MTRFVLFVALFTFGCAGTQRPVGLPWVPPLSVAELAAVWPYPESTAKPGKVCRADWHKLRRHLATTEKEVVRLCRQPANCCTVYKGGFATFVVAPWSKPDACTDHELMHAAIACARAEDPVRWVVSDDPAHKLAPKVWAWESTGWPWRKSK